MSNQNNKFEYFKLFQEQNAYSNKLLEDAKKIKQSIQEIYNDIFLSDGENYDSWVFDFDADIKQVSEQPEPDALKLFTRQYTPVVNVYKNNVPLCTPIKFDMESKCIHKHINELYVGDGVSQEYFFDVAQQYFLLDFVYRQIENGNFTETFVSKMKESCSDYDQAQRTTICVNCKLMGRKTPKMLDEKINPNLHSAISHINTLWRYLSEQSNFVLIGNYLNYLNEDELISQLNNSDFVSGAISNYFQNDFLLLNNMEFPHQKANTKGWNDKIFAPSLLEKKNEKYCLKYIDAIKQIGNQIFLYQRIKQGDMYDMFYKTEIYIPKKDMDQNTFNQIISLSMKLLKFKQQKN